MYHQISKSKTTIFTIGSIQNVGNSMDDHSSSRNATVVNPNGNAVSHLFRQARGTVEPMTLTGR